MRRTIALLVLAAGLGAAAPASGATPCPVRLELSGGHARAMASPLREALVNSGFAVDPEARFVLELVAAQSGDQDRSSEFFLYQVCGSAMVVSNGDRAGAVPLTRDCTHLKRSDVDAWMALRTVERAWARDVAPRFIEKLLAALKQVPCPAPPVVVAQARPLDAGRAAGPVEQKVQGGEAPPPPPVGMPWALIVAGSAAVVGGGGFLLRWLPRRKRAGLPAVFVCYAHEDNSAADPKRRWVARLREHLEPLVQGKLLTVWWDREIPLGARWDATIQKALDQAFAAVVLVSPDALASSYIVKTEIPALLRRLDGGGLVVIPVAVRPSTADIAFRYEGPQGKKEARLTDLQWPHDVATGLSEMDGDAADEILRRIAARLAALAAGKSDTEGAAN